MVKLDPIYMTFVDQGHRSKFKVTGGKCFFLAENESFKMGKSDPTTWRKSRPEFL